MTEEQRQYNKEYYQKHKEERLKYAKEYRSKRKKEIKEKKYKSITYYVLRTPGKKDAKFKKIRDARMYSYVYHNDYPTYSIHKINIVTTEELIESGENEVGEDDMIQAVCKKERK